MVRKSTRSKSNPKTYKDVSSSESESDISNAEESDYEVEPEPVTKTRKHTTKNPKGKTTKRQKKQSRKSLETLESELEENYLYQVLSHANVEVSDIAMEWIESYEEDQENDTQEAITMLINLLLRSCGSVSLFQPHDLVNLESCAQTVAEMTMAFKEQTAHRYPFKAVATFKSNVLEFFEKVIQIAHDKGLLYNTDATRENEEDSMASPLMQYLLTWITSLTTSKIRPLRFTTTDTIFAIQVQLCRIIKNVNSNLDKQKKQLTKIKNKSKQATVSKTVSNYENQKNTITEYFDDIGRIVVSIRYRDPDPQIRLLCLKHLSECMSIYPELFCKDTYLKYFGWLLSDPIGSVRTENCRVLLKLYKNLTFADSTPILRLFTEKFKLQLIKMSKIDSDAQVRTYSLGICSELFRLGFLEDEGVTEIIKTYKFNKVSKVHLSKLQHEYAKFIHSLNEKSLQDLQEKYNLFLETYQSNQFEDQLEDCLKIKGLIELTSSIDGDIAGLYSALCHIPYYAECWEFLIRYFLVDISSVKFKSKTKEEDTEQEEVDNEEIEEFRQFIDLSDSDRVYLLKFVQGALVHMTAAVKSPKNEEETSNLLVRLVDYLPNLQTKSIKVPALFSVFLSIWTGLISEPKDAINIFNLFTKLDRTDVYDDSTESILKFYKEADLVEEFDAYFQKLFESNALTSANRSYVQSILSELVAEINDAITEQEEDFSFVDDNSELTIQRSLIRKISIISPALMKLRQLGDHINISNLERIEDLNETLVKKVLRKLDLAIIMAEWKYNFLQKLPDFIQSMQKLIDLLLIVLSWKFEKLMELPSEHQHHKDIEAEFDSIIDMVNQMIRLIYECKDVNLVDLKTLLAIKYVDLLTFFRIFYVKFNQDNQFENFQSFYSSNLQLLMIRRDLQNELLELFLIKEVRLAHELNVDLDRGDEEDVNYDDYLELPPSEIEVSIFDEENAALESEGSSRPSTTQNAERAWLYEKELSVYSLKLISLVNLSLLHDDIHSRIRLNADKLGGIFGTIITRQDEHIAKIKDKQQLQPEPESESAPIADEQQPETIQEEIEV